MRSTGHRHDAAARTVVRHLCVSVDGTERRFNRAFVDDLERGIRVDQSGHRISLAQRVANGIEYHAK
jgi:hypothetical protein